jgi:hypothetical protein
MERALVHQPRRLPEAAHDDDADSTSRAFLTVALGSQEIEAAYRSSWLMRKAVDRPANDMTRAWRDWQAEKATDHRCSRPRRSASGPRQGQARGHPGQARRRRAHPRRARRDPMLPLNPRDRQGRAALHPRRLALPAQPRPDRAGPGNDLFGQPAYFELNSATGGQRVKLHPSRVIPSRACRCRTWAWRKHGRMVLGRQPRPVDPRRGEERRRGAEQHREPDRRGEGRHHQGQGPERARSLGGIREPPS